MNAMNKPPMLRNDLYTRMTSGQYPIDNKLSLT